MEKKKLKAGKEFVGEERIIDLLERLGVLFLYTSTPLGQNEVAKAVGIGVHRVSDLVGGIKKPSKQN